MDQHVRTGVLGRDVEPLILDPLRQEFADIAFPAADIEDRMAGLGLRELLREPIADAFLTPVPPRGAVAIKRGQLGRAWGYAFSHKEGESYLSSRRCASCMW